MSDAEKLEVMYEAIAQAIDLIPRTSETHDGLCVLVGALNEVRTR